MNWKLLFIDKAILILSIFSIVMGLLVNAIFIIMKQNSDFVIFYNFYFLFFTGAFWIIIIMRLVFLFLYSKIDDKTIYIISVHQISRKKIFTSQWLAMIFFLLLLSMINFFTINIISLLINLNFNKLVFKVTLVHFIYSIFISICLINFFVLLAMILKSSITTILITLMLSATFISNLPYQFLESNEKISNIAFNSSVGTPYVAKTQDVYKAFDLQQSINKGHIKYPNLSKYINDYYVNEKLRKDQFSSNANINLRYNLWNSLGLIKNEPKKVTANNLKVKAVPRQGVNSEIAVGTAVDLNLTFSYTFISSEELKKLIDQEIDSTKIKILKELLEFSESITEFYTSAYEFQNETKDFYGDMIKLDEGTIKAKDGVIETNYLESNLINSYKLSFTDGIEGIQFEKSDSSRQLFENLLYEPLYLSIRVLENYFINYTSDYVIYKSYEVNKDSDEWKKYMKSRTNYNIFSMFNFIGSTMSIYTYYSGESYQDIWFEPKQKSFIDLKKQNNLFLSYQTYTFKLKNNIINYDSYNNYIKPYVFLILQLSICAFNFFIGIYLFSRRDLI
ncbi:ABC transporter permease [Spiroplasma endosymbiont of Dioctria linearis]|uniref:ABC transporter permease n=1 Tax=Spiroplasma endosymbiont of Dioctria linearis TaxID=3066290 RepID=UPI00313C4F87